MHTGASCPLPTPTPVWCNFWILKPGSQAILAFVFGEYLAAAITGANLDGGDGGDGDDSGSQTWATLLAISAVVLLTAFNTLNIRSSANFQVLVSHPIIAGVRIRIWVGAIFGCHPNLTLERQILARVVFGPELGFIDSS